MPTYTRPIFNKLVSFCCVGYTIESFTSPSNVTVSGVDTLGGDVFAVARASYRHPGDSSSGYPAGEYVEEVSSNNSYYPSHYSFDGNSSTFSVTSAYQGYNGYFFIYNPDPINIESITITMRSSIYGIRSFYLQYSDDNETYTTLEYFNAGSTSPSTWNITVTPYNGYHKYYRWEIDRGSRDSTSYRNVQMTNIVLRGTKKVIG